MTVQRYKMPDPTLYNLGHRVDIAHVDVVYASAYDALAARLAESEAECLEQARLNGMGSEREARLIARLAEYEAKDGQRTREHNILVRENREQAARLAEAERLLREADTELYERCGPDGDGTMSVMAACDREKFLSSTDSTVIDPSSIGPLTRIAADVASVTADSAEAAPTEYRCSCGATFRTPWARGMHCTDKGHIAASTADVMRQCKKCGLRYAPLAAHECPPETAPAVTCDHFPGQAVCEWCKGTGAIDAPTSADDPSCPDCDGEGYV